MTKTRNRIRKRRTNDAQAEISTTEIKPSTKGIMGGKLKVLEDRDVKEIHETSIQLLTKVGFSEYSRQVKNVIETGGGHVNGDGRLCFSKTSIKNSIND